jgi:DinB family protein
MDYHTLTMPELQEEADRIARDAEKLFGGLSAAQLNWKPGPEQWGVAQCLEHLINANREMHGPLDEILAGTQRTRLLERVPGLAGLWGRVMVKSLEPESPRRLKAPRSAVPSASAVEPDIVRRFVARQRETIERMRSLEGRDPARVVITSPFLKLVVYSALDACRIIVVHERRHFAQAQRVMAAPGFPG